jgi:hypothetical protein
MTVELWAALGTIIGTLVLVVAPGLLYAWAVLDGWVGGGDRYPEV